MLKYHHTILFKPELPMINKNAIEGTSFGTIGKIYLKFTEPFLASKLEWSNIIIDRRGSQ